MGRADDSRLPVNEREVEVTQHYNVTKRGGHLTYAQTDFIRNFFKGFSRRIRAYSLTISISHMSLENDRQVENRYDL